LGALEKNRRRTQQLLKLWKNSRRKNHGFEGMAKKKKMVLGTLEKTMKNKTMTLKFRPQRRKP